MALSASRVPRTSCSSSCCGSRHTRPQRVAPVQAVSNMGGVPSTSTSSSSSRYIQAGPSAATPDYATLDAQPLNRAVMGLFRRKMVAAIGEDVPEQGYDGIIALTRKLNSQFEPRETQVRTVGILTSLFPAWLPSFFAVMFARPVPVFSARMNAWATALTCRWLMGPCEVNDATRADGTVHAGQGVRVERCRYLEEAGCASICINSCKAPTQEFFHSSMGLDLTMTPNYDDFSCQFSFGETPLPADKDPAFVTPCFVQCPSKRKAQAAAEAAASCCPGIAKA